MRKELKEGSEIRSFAMPDLQADEAGTTVQGHAAVFDQQTDMFWYTETIARGAFDQTDFKDVLMTINHDLDGIPLARSRNNNSSSTLQLQVDEQGLDTRAVLDVENNTEAKALYSAVKRGDMSAMSFIFKVKEDEWTNLDSDMPHRTIKSIAKVFEVSAVSFPAYAGTDINARSSNTLDNAKRALDSARAKELESSNEQRNQAELVKELRKNIKLKVGTI
ncbi:hypothetical protein SAMN05660742_111121 [Propionispira arboris]|uniref:Prohead serine protease domain-containing protein n=1 Tax=Propionispira arboris TaxID=84035 RepID=A0A1H7A8I2_9FIRM|nr:HK97 family phage prohead protease [Propionispira arboris]SEJ60207.1 hypothetical protein SAMN05660742_111121 [Propionispira arboris]